MIEIHNLLNVYFRPAIVAHCLWHVSSSKLQKIIASNTCFLSIVYAFLGKTCFHGTHLVYEYNNFDCIRYSI